MILTHRPLHTIRRLISSGTLTGYRLNSRIIRVAVEDVDACFKPIPTVKPQGESS